MNYKGRYDIFICGGSRHFGKLKALLPRLHPFSRLHLASITLAERELSELSPHYDVLHRPRHDADGYLNFNLFCIRDINRLASAPHFIKLDADVTARADWVEYVDAALGEHPDAVLFGIKEGLARVNVRLAGPLVRRKLGREISVSDGRKVIGGFYVGQTAFFKRHDRLMQLAHEFLYCFKDGRRVRPSPSPEEWDAQTAPLAGAFTVEGHYQDLHKIGNEDALRSLVVHAAGAADRMFVLDSGGRLSVPHGPGTHEEQ
jgi:hypothetical protein